MPICTSPTIDVNSSSADIDRLVKEKLSSAASIYRIDTGLLKELRPTHVLTQTLCDVCAVSMADVQAAFQDEVGLAVEIVPLSASSLEGVWSDIRRVASSLQADAAAQELVTTLQLRMDAVSARVAAEVHQPRVAAIEWLDPLMAAGNWVPELIARAGGENLFGTAGTHSPWMEWDELRRANPDIIVALPCGFDLARARSEMPALLQRDGWSSLRAVQSGHLYVCDGNQFMNRPGPRLAESLEIFAEICHPEMFPPRLEGIGWERF